MERTDILRKTVLFGDLNIYELVKVNKITHSLKVDADTTIISEGEDGDALYIIKEGQVRVSKKGESGGEEVLAMLEPGDHFGEVALVDSGPRSASVIATQETELIKITRDDFQRILTTDRELALKFYQTFVHVLCERLRSMNESLTFSRSLLWSPGIRGEGG